MLSFPLAIAIAAAATLFVRAADAAEIRLLASNAVKEAYADLIPEFEKQTGHHVDAVWGGTTDLKGRVAQGAVADLLITPAGDIDDMIGKGHLVAGSRTDLAKSIVGAAVKLGLAKPDISSSAKLKAALLSAKSVILSGGPSGIYLLGWFEKEGLLPALNSKMKQLPSGESVGEALARGEGDLGFTQVSEFIHIKDINYVGPLSPDVQKVTVFSAGLLKSAPQPEAAKALVRFLTAAESRAALVKAGLQPPA
jgi:molybdate transport system substrate-binding protein